MEDKEKYLLLERIKADDDYLQREIKDRELKIKILEAEIGQLNEFINIIQRLGELETNRIEGNK